MKFSILVPIRNGFGYGYKFMIKYYSYLPILPIDTIIKDKLHHFTIEFIRYYVETGELSYQCTEWPTHTIDLLYGLGFREYRK